MVRPKLAVAVGAILLLIGFATGTWLTTVPVHGAPPALCDPVLDLTRLPFNESAAGPAVTVPGRTPEARREESACEDATLPLRVVTWTALAVGGLLALAGWTALRERDVRAPRTSFRSRLTT